MPQLCPTSQHHEDPFPPCCAGHLDSGQCVLFDEDIYQGQGDFVSGELREVDGAMRFVPALDPHPSIMC